MTTKPATGGNYTAEQRMRFAAGRRRYHARMQAAAELRRCELVRLLRDTELSHGWQSRLAEALGVNRSTVCRDFRVIRSESKKRKSEKTESDLDRRFCFLQMLVRSLDEDQTRQRVLQERSEANEAQR